MRAGCVAHGRGGSARRAAELVPAVCRSVVRGPGGRGKAEDEEGGSQIGSRARECGGGERAEASDTARSPERSDGGAFFLSRQPGLDGHGWTPRGTRWWRGGSGGSPGGRTPGGGWGSPGRRTPGVVVSVGLEIQRGLVEGGGGTAADPVQAREAAGPPGGPEAGLVGAHEAKGPETTEFCVLLLWCRRSRCPLLLLAWKSVIEKGWGAPS